MVEPGLDEGSTDIPEQYQRLRFRVPTADEDQFVAAIWSLGTLGLESREVAAGTCEILAYFTNPLAPGLLDQIEGRNGLAGANLTDVDLISDQDWQREYRARSVPFAVGEYWWVDPREPDQPVSTPPDQRRLLRIPARMAFGTGSHASTALIVELMDRQRLTGKRVLDVGTGSGILAMVALESGAESVTALDIDPIAAFTALQTCRLNHLRPRLLAGGLGAIRLLPAAETFDVIVANVLPALLRSDLAALIDCLPPAGVLLLSGLLRTQEADMLAEVTGLGLHRRSHLVRDEWVALHLERTAR